MLSPTSRPSSIRRLRCHDIDFSDGLLSLTLSWLTVDSPADPVDHCNVYATCIVADRGDGSLPVWRGGDVFLGRAHAPCFRAAGLRVLNLDGSESAARLSYEMSVQPVAASRRKPAVKSSPCLVVQLTP